ncbi:MAG: hypothetical protein AAFY88_25935 [Acidobacteriota bacterium]
MHSPSPQSAPATTAPVSLLRLIANDADFRAKLESDPVAAFAEHGINVAFEGQPKLHASIWDDIRDWLDGQDSESDDDGTVNKRWAHTG